MVEKVDNLCQTIYILVGMGNKNSIYIIWKILWFVLLRGKIYIKLSNFYNNTTGN